MSVYPYMRTPLSDLTAQLFNHQQYDKCAVLEVNYLECLEAYGVDLGKTKCDEVARDFSECYLMSKQMARVVAMKAERQRQFKAGERKDEFAPPPRMDAY